MDVADAEGYNGIISPARGREEVAMSARCVTDGGLETDLIFHHGVDLPDFAAFALLDDPDGRALLVGYYAAYAEVARSAGASLLLETPTWRASADWGRRLGYDPEDLARINTEAVAFLREVVAEHAVGVDGVEVSGQLGPRGDGYVSAAPTDPGSAADYHAPQLAAFARAGADRATAMTLTDVGEALGLARAAEEIGIRLGVGFTVETDGRLPDGSTLAEAIDRVDAVCAPDHYVVNCAHPDHVVRGLAGAGAWRERIEGVRFNASTLSHAELDEATTLDDGDPGALAASAIPVVEALPMLRVIGGCCGTDARHVAALWGVPAPD